jgi:hypothetical protein
MPALLRNLLIAAALLAPAAAAAQDAPAGEPQIVVTGQRPSKDAIASFVDALVPVPRGKLQLARFHWAICPLAGGMMPAQGAAVEQRIRTVARAAGIDVAGARCAPNLLVIVTPDKAAFLAALSKRRPEYFGDLTRDQRRAIYDPANPVAAWHVEGPPLTADGQEMHYDSHAGYYVNRTTDPPSRIGFAARPQFAAAIVVIEERALDGLTTTQLADYAAMRTLVASDPGRLGASTAPTILRIIDAPMGSEIPITMTSWDMGVLKSFYASNPTVSAAAQRSDVRKRLGGELEGKGGERN